VVLADQAGGPADLSVRLGIAGELFDDVSRTGGDTPDLRRAVRDLLSGAEAAMMLLDPDIPVLPESADDLEHWFPGRTDLTTAPVRPVAPGIRSRADDSRDLPLFAGVPA